MVSLLVLAALLFPFSVWPSNSFKVFKDVLMINFALFIFCQAAIEERDGLKAMMQISVLSSVILLLGMYYHPVIVENDRVSTTYTYDANDIAMMFSCFLPLVFYFYTATKSIKRYFFLLLVILLVLGVLKTGSRGGLLSLMAGIVQILFFSRLVKRSIYKWMLVLLVCIAMLSPLAANVRERWQTVLSGEDYNVANTEAPTGGRIAIWRSGLGIFAENFITGVGIGNASTAMGNKFGKFGWLTIHNAYIQVAVELGIIGLLIYLSMLKTVWTNCSIVLKMPGSIDEGESEDRRNLANALQISLVSYIVAAFFLSQAFSFVIPFLLVCSTKLRQIHNPKLSKTLSHRL